MSVRRILFLILGLCFALALASRAQDEPGLSIREEDERITTIEERQRSVATLITRATELRNSGQALEAARSLNRAGRFQIRLYLREDAVATFHEALKLLEQAPDRETQIDSLNGLGKAYRGLSKCDLAQSALDQAITLSKQTDYKAGHAEALLTLSDCQNYYDHTLALRSAHEALELWRSLGNKRGLAQAHSLIAGYEMAQYKLAESRQSFETALTLWRELNATDQQADILINLGFIEFRKGAWQDSLAFYTQAQNLLDEKAEPYMMGQIAAGLAEAFIESGLPEVGLVKFRQALDYYRLTKDPRPMIAMGWGIGKAQYLSGHYSEALVSLQNARAEAAAIKESTLLAICDDFLGRTYYALNDTALALRHFQAAIDGYTKTKNQLEVARTRALMGQVYQQLGGFEKARSSYQGALTTFRTLSDRVNESATLYALGSLELKQNQLDRAEDYLRNSIDVTENMRRVSTSSDLTAAFSATVHDRYESYVDCLMRKHQAAPTRDFAPRAFQMSELARGRSLAELLRATQTNLAPGVDPQLAHREKSLRQSLIVKENYKVALLGKQYTQEELNRLESEIARLAAEYKQLNDAIIARYPSYGEINRPTGWDLRQIQEQVIADDETVLVEYSLGADRSYVWTVTRNDITSRELPPEAAITKAVQEVYGLMTSTPGAETENNLSGAIHKLSFLVLSPIAAELKKRRVIVVADGALNYVPFQILYGQPGNDEPLVATREVINAPSASILGQLRQETARRQAPPKALAAFGDPVFASNYPQYKNASSNDQIAASQSSDGESWRHALRDIEPAGDSFDPSKLQPLFYSRVELANLRDVAGPSSFVATGFEATREKLAEADLAEYAILHIATHGILDPKRPENSGLFLSMVDREGKAQNGFVGLQDIYSLHAPVDLVVLSACRTGLGKDVRGEGLIGLTRGFMYAGASSVVASLWKVDDEATAELMKRFYTNMLVNGMTPAAALRAAQNSIREQPQWRSPYYWAAFTLQGDYRQVLKPAPRRTWSYGALVFSIGVSTALIAIALWWYFSRRRHAGRA